MSVLIKMEIPRSCADCPLTWVDDEYDKRCCITDKVVLGTIGRQDNANCTDCDCPLIEVPPLTLTYRDLHSILLTYRDLHGILAEKPTIIEKEGGERQ